MLRGLGLVGRISGVGDSTSRVILLTDAASRIPVTIQPSGQQSLLVGDNNPSPLLEFLEDSDQVRPGDRVVSSGDGGVFPPGILVGQLNQGPDGRLRVRLSSDYERLEFLRVLRSHGTEVIRDIGGLIAPEGAADALRAEAEARAAAEAAEAEAEAAAEATTAPDADATTETAQAGGR